MSDPKQANKEQQAPESGGLPLWKKTLLALAALSLLVGFGLRFAGSSKSGTGTEAGRMSAQSSDGQSLVGGQSASSGAAESSGLEGFAPFFVKGGFSFFIGFCLGMALRSFFKISAIVIGLFALGMFALSYAGVLEIDWTRIESWYDSLAGRVRDEAGGFKDFVTGSLPAAGLATVGLITGFKK